MIEEDAGTFIMDTPIPLPNLPRPDHLPALLGYPRHSERVALYWDCDDLVWADVEASANTADWYAWRLYTEHPKIAPFFAPFQWYEETGRAPHALLFNQTTDQVLVGRTDYLDNWLGRAEPTQCPGLPLVLTDHEYAALTARLEADLAQQARHIETQQQRMERMKRWLETL